MTYKKRKKSRIFMFLSPGCSLLRAEGFSCSLGVLYGGLGISKLQFLIKKIEIKFPAINFFQLSGSGNRIRNPDLQLEKMLDPDPKSWFAWQNIFTLIDIVKTSGLGDQ
jgi:hypothetical protein